MRKLIAFIGKMGAGKTTAADYLVSEHGFERVSFAARLKEIATKACRMQGKDRELLQNLGCMIREDCPTYWLDVVKKKIHTSEKSIVIDDLRFKNEMEMLFKEGFLIIRLETPRAIRRERMGLPTTDTVEDTEKHISETDLDDVQVVTGNMNCGDKRELGLFVNDVIQNYTQLWKDQEEYAKDFLFRGGNPPAWFTSR